MKNFEQFRASVYEMDNKNPDFTTGSDCHYKTKKKLFQYSDILAIASKGSSKDDLYRNLKRGGALIYVKGRQEPYVTCDKESVDVLVKKLNRNPFACCSGLNQVGSSNIYAKRYSLIDKNHIFLEDIKVSLYITNYAYRTIKWVDDVLKGKLKKSCFFATKKRLRAKYKKM